TEADLAVPANTLANLAAYYSAGAQSPISAADIQAPNPGVSVALASIFAIPTLQYTIASASAPANTFGSIGQYYGLSPDAVAALFLDVPGLFPADTTLQLDSQSFDVKTSAAPGNIAIDLVRENLGAPGTLPINPT